VSPSALVELSLANHAKYSSSLSTDSSPSEKIGKELICVAVGAAGRAVATAAGAGGT